MEQIKPRSPEKKEKSYTLSQARALELLRSYDGAKVVCEMSIGELADQHFLKALAELNLSVEISCTEGLNGLVHIQTGELDADGHASSGDAVDAYRHERGKFSVHTHISDTPQDLVPSEGDVNKLCVDRHQHTAAPAMIINSYGISIIGLNPFASEIDKAFRDSASPQENSEMSRHIERGGWDSYSRTFIYKRLHKRVDVLRDMSVDEKLQVLLEIGKEVGVILAHKSWQEITPDDMGLVFNPKLAEAFWRKRTDLMVADIMSGRVRAESFLQREREILDRSPYEYLDHIKQAQR